MDFSDITRSGTAPSSKAKPYFYGFAGLSARPKTRAVDNDIQDTNSELRMNRVKAGGHALRDSVPSEIMDTVVSSLSEGIDFDGASWPGGTMESAAGSSRRAGAPPSRNRAKDPKRTGNNLVGGPSAYTQSIPNIILNTSKKPTKPHSANTHTSPRMGQKEAKNINQINELRAAYGADIPLGKGDKSSPARPKSMKLQGQMGLGMDDRPKSRTSRPKEVVTTNRMGASPSPELVPLATGELRRHSDSHSSQGTPDPESRPVLDSRPKPRTAASSKSLLRTSFGAKSAATLSGESQSDSEVFLSVPIELVAPAPDFSHPNRFFEPPAQNAVPAASKAAPSPAKGQAVVPTGKHDMPMPSQLGELDRAIAIPNVEERHFEEDDGADFYIDEGEDDGMDSPITERRRQPSGKAASPVMEPVLVHADESSSGRPQSRKLYLGAKNTSEKPAGKAPRSAGARYGSFSPLGGVEGGHENQSGSHSAHGKLRKSGSHSDVQQMYQWLGEEEALAQRPPSRQSSAFPVHLAEPPVGLATPNAAPLHAQTPSSSQQPLSQSSAAQPQQPQSLQATSSPQSQLQQAQSRMGDAVPTTSQGLRASSGKSSVAKRLSADFPKDLSDMDAFGGEILSKGVAPQPNTEPKEIKKTRSAAAAVEEDSPPTAQRPPSRQKVAAQHLFDGAHDQGSISIALNAPMMSAVPGGAMGNSVGVMPVSSSASSSPAKQSMSAPVSQATSAMNAPSAVGAASGGAAASWMDYRGSNPSSGRSLKWEDAKKPAIGSMWVESTMLAKPSSNAANPANNSGNNNAATTTGRLRTAGRNTSHGSRSGLSYDPHRDGFSELGPLDNSAPFSVTVSYGPDDQGYRKAGAGAHAEDLPVTDQLADLSLRPRGGADKGSARRTNDSAAPLLSPMRPKSVSATDTGGGNGFVAIAPSHPRPGRAPRPQNASGSEQLRSKSAQDHHRQQPQHHSHQHAQYVDHHQFGADSSGGGYYGGSSAATNRASYHDSGLASKGVVTSVGVWSENSEQDHYYPRAQNTFGLCADSGWTSPSMLQTSGVFTKSSSPSAYSDGEGMYRDEDYMTVMTDEEPDESNNFEHNISLQSFQLESSLGEDFLSLFAPAGR